MPITKIQRAYSNADGSGVEDVEELRDEAGVKVGERVVAQYQRVESAAFTTARTALKTARDALATKADNNRARLDLLAGRAARYARDPVANAADQLSDRLQHEFLARLWLNEKTDDM